MLQRSYRVIAGLLVAFAVGACAGSPYRTSNLQEVKADGMSVVITHARSETDARPLAEDYCRTHGGAAHFRGMMQYRTRRETMKAAAFECRYSLSPSAAVG
jgi:hypothetical protein